MASDEFVRWSDPGARGKSKHTDQVLGPVHYANVSIEDLKIGQKMYCKVNNYTKKKPYFST